MVNVHAKRGLYGDYCLNNPLKYVDRTGQYYQDYDWYDNWDSPHQLNGVEITTSNDFHLNAIDNQWDFINTILDDYLADAALSKMAKDGFITFLFNKDLIANFEQMVIPSTGKSFFPTVSTITYKYDRDNLKEKIWEINESQRTTFIYKTYDNMKNPYYKYYSRLSIARNIEIVASKNNLLESNILDSFTPEYLGINKYSYKYDNDFPIEVDAH